MDHLIGEEEEEENESQWISDSRQTEPSPPFDGFDFLITISHSYSLLRTLSKREEEIKMADLSSTGVGEPESGIHRTLRVKRNQIKQ